MLAAAPHQHPIGLGRAGLVEAHAEVARLVLGHQQRQLLRLRLLPRLVARQRHRFRRLLLFRPSRLLLLLLLRLVLAEREARR